MVDLSYSQGILTIRFTGEINFANILDYLKDFDEYEELPSNLLLLYIFDDVDMEAQLTPGEIEMISHVAERKTGKYKSVKSAFLANQPKVTAYITLFAELGNKQKTRRKLFSTREAAIKWLKQP